MSETTTDLIQWLEGKTAFLEANAASMRRNFPQCAEQDEAEAARFRAVIEMLRDVQSCARTDTNSRLEAPSAAD